MDELIAKLEAATEGSRELDLDIGIHLGHFRIENSEEYENTLWDLREERNVFCGSEGQWKYDCPHYTTSIDTALTLVPEGCSPSMISWRVESITEPTDRVNASVIGEDETKFPDGRHFSGSGATPPLALSSAALKAMKATE